MLDALKFIDSSLVDTHPIRDFVKNRFPTRLNAKKSGINKEKTEGDRQGKLSKRAVVKEDGLRRCIFKRGD